ncbi:ESX secretion-associated protein EspG [Amycolatopsis sp. H20-H5]|uniref:ESX secretion-associated protein EspG n=1 Tax=Amycolatopsis sp. H20-H5 TaxID=3046309 RepID=UPI002DBA51B3|nr:ESX secretion-associated protein EspG [Amycolatopsis sp. H20-H5]MEC3977181.1 ESX secretion-associated protein EspG [Amycolatopsis sp. H20-H5]
MIEHPIVLPKLAFVTAWGMLDLADPHPVIGTNITYWMTDDARRSLDTRTMELLTTLKLARNGRLNSLWTTTLQTIDGAHSEYYCWNEFRDGTTYGILIAVRGTDDAVRVVVDRDTVLLEPIPTKWPATSLLDALPDVPPASVRSVSVPRNLVENPNAAPANPLAEPVDTRDVDYLTGVLAAPRDAVHQLYTATRDEDGDRVRSMPLTAIDLTNQGRILTYRTGDDHIVLESGTPRECVATLNDTHSGLT